MQLQYELITIQLESIIYFII